MNDFLKMDIFFFVTTIGVVALTILAIYLAWQVSRILSYAEHILRQVAAESDLAREDLAEIRTQVRAGKGKIKSLFSFFSRKVKRARKKG